MQSDFAILLLLHYEWYLRLERRCEEESRKKEEERKRPYPWVRTTDSPATFTAF
jgi:hypothetical protein